jgi:DNA-binding transcriptional MerR regulator
MQMLTISAFAREVSVTPGTLRRYEREGLLTAARDSSGRRLYRVADVERVRKLVERRRASRGSGLRARDP